MLFRAAAASVTFLSLITCAPALGTGDTSNAFWISWCVDPKFSKEDQGNKNLRTFLNFLTHPLLTHSLLHSHIPENEVGVFVCGKSRNVTTGFSGGNTGRLWHGFTSRRSRMDFSLDPSRLDLLKLDCAWLFIFNTGSVCCCQNWLFSKGVDDLVALPAFGVGPEKHKTEDVDFGYPAGLVALPAFGVGLREH